MANECNFLLHFQYKCQKIRFNYGLMQEEIKCLEKNIDDPSLAIKFLL